MSSSNDNSGMGGMGGMGSNQQSSGMGSNQQSSGMGGSQQKKEGVMDRAIDGAANLVKKRF